MEGKDSQWQLKVSAEPDTEWQDWLVNEGQDQEIRLGERQELQQRRRMLGAAMDQLNDRERHILVERRLRDNPITLEGLSQEYNISRERVRQIEVRAFNKVQKAVRKSTMAKRTAVHMPRQKRPEAQLAAA